MQDQLRQDVRRLAEPGSRKVGSVGHALSREYLIHRMSTSGLKPYFKDTYELPYEKDGQRFTNLAGLLPGLDSSLDPVLLIAHYDTCGDQPGADDNAAAIAIWLNLIHRLKNLGLERPLLFLFPDAEEPPHFLSESMGSTNFYLHQKTDPIHAGLVLDLVGHDVPLEKMEDLIFIIGAESHPSMADILLAVEPPVGLRNMATLNRYVGDLSDHHILRENGEPYLFFTCGRWDHYHQESDIPEHLNYAKMELIAQYLVAMVKQVANAEFSQPFGDFDPVEMELKLIDRAIGPYLSSQGIAMKNRDDIQRYVQQLVSQHKI